MLPAAVCRRCVSSTSAAQLGLRPSTTALVDVVEARRQVFGEIPGNGKRSGRKWLRRCLRGPSIKSWYGVHFSDILPNFITDEKVEVFLNEQQLNRVGKSRITGKMKPYAKPLVDTMLFEETLDEVMDTIEFDTSDALLSEQEIQRRDDLMRSADSSQTAAVIQEMFDRLAAEREERREEWEGKLGGKSDKSGYTRKEDIKFRVLPGSAKAKAAAEGEGGETATASADAEVPAAAAAGAAGDAGATTAPVADAAPTPATGGDGTPSASAPSEDGMDATATPPAAAVDPLTELAAVTEFTVEDPSTMSPEELNAAYDKFCAHKASVEWNALQLVKEDPVLATLWKDAVSVLEQEGLPLSAQGLEQLYLKEREEQVALLQASISMKKAGGGSGGGGGGSKAASRVSGGEGGAGGEGRPPRSQDRRGGGGGSYGGTRGGGGGEGRRQYRDEGYGGGGGKRGGGGGGGGGGGSRGGQR